MEIHKRKQERKHAFDQESEQEKKKENTLSTKKVRFKKKKTITIQKKEGRKTQNSIKHIASFFRCIQFCLMTETSG